MKNKKIIFLFILVIILFNTVNIFSAETYSTEISKLIRVISLRDYNTRIVLLGTMLLGLACGVIGSFMLMRKRSLMADAISHATLPGIGIAFIIMTIMFKGTGKNLAGLLFGALLSGLIGMAFIVLIQKITKLKEEASLGIVLSVFFGMGVAVLGIIQKMKSGHAAGLESFIYGKTASMLTSDAWMISIIAFIIIVICTLLFKEFTILCFDFGFAMSQGWPVFILDIIMMSLVVAVTVIGLQAVGLILIIAMLIIPPASARFWTDHLLKMLIISALIGALSGSLGAALSAVYAKLPAGAIIVVTAGFFFLLSMVFGKAKGILIRFILQVQLGIKVNLQHMLRAIFEYYENNINEFKATVEILKNSAISYNDLLELKSWSKSKLNRILLTANIKGFIKKQGNEYKFTEKGCNEAIKIVKNHRMWEIFLITHADVATGKVDRDADRLEHLLGTDMVHQLEEILKKENPHLVMPESPHELKYTR